MFQNMWHIMYSGMKYCRNATVSISLTDTLLPTLRQGFFLPWSSFLFCREVVYILQWSYFSLPWAVLLVVKLLKQFFFAMSRITFRWIVFIIGREAVLLFREPVLLFREPVLLCCDQFYFDARVLFCREQFVLQLQWTIFNLRWTFHILCPEQVVTLPWSSFTLRWADFSFCLEQSLLRGEEFLLQMPRPGLLYGEQILLCREQFVLPWTVLFAVSSFTFPWAVLFAVSSFTFPWAVLFAVSNSYFVTNRFYFTASSSTLPWVVFSLLWSNLLCREQFYFAVSDFICREEFLLCHEQILLYREQFYFAVSRFFFVVKQFTLPGAVLFYREQLLPTSVCREAGLF